MFPLDGIRGRDGRIDWIVLVFILLLFTLNVDDVALMVGGDLLLAWRDENLILSLWNLDEFDEDDVDT